MTLYQLYFLLDFFQKISLWDVLNETLFVFYKFIFNFLTVLRSFLIKLIVFFLNIINCCSKIFHVVHEHKNIVFDLLWHIAKSFIFEDVVLADFDMLKVLCVDSSPVFLNLNFQLLKVIYPVECKIHRIETGICSHSLPLINLNSLKNI